MDAEISDIAVAWWPTAPWDLVSCNDWPVERVFWSGRRNELTVRVDGLLATVWCSRSSLSFTPSILLFTPSILPFTPLNPLLISARITEPGAAARSLMLMSRHTPLHQLSSSASDDSKAFFPQRP